MYKDVKDVSKWMKLAEGMTNEGSSAAMDDYIHIDYDYEGKDSGEVPTGSNVHFGKESEGRRVIGVGRRSGYDGPPGEKGPYGHVDASKKTITTPIIYAFVGDFHEGRAAVYKEGRGASGHVDKDGNVTTPLIYDMAHEFSEGLAPVRLNNKEGYVNKEGKLIIPLIYKHAYYFKNGKALVCKRGKWGVIDKNNDILTPFEYEETNGDGKGNTIGLKGGKWEIIDC